MIISYRREVMKMPHRAGKHVLCGTGETAYKCFAPQTMPPQGGIRIDEDMIYLLSEAGRQLGRLDEVTDSLIAPNYFVYMYARKEAALSSQIEGTRATFTDLIRKVCSINHTLSVGVLP